jgi:5'-nucleotidase
MRKTMLMMITIVTLHAHFAAESSMGQMPDDKSRLLILLSNDDGIDAPGIRALIEALRPIAEIVVAAPAGEQSGKGHGLQLHDPIFVTERKQPQGQSWYAIEGPPATCVRLAVESLLPRRPDLVVSGVNRGENLGLTVYNAGTLGPAREAAIVGIPSIAVSTRGGNEADFRSAAGFIRHLVEHLQGRSEIKPGLFLNVNVPSGENKGVRVVRLSTKTLYDTFERRASPRGRVYYWPDWRQLEEDDEGTDVWAFVRGFITVTPMTLDVTAYPVMKRLNWLETP